MLTRSVTTTNGVYELLSGGDWRSGSQVNMSVC